MTIIFNISIAQVPYAKAHNAKNLQRLTLIMVYNDYYSTTINININAFLK